MARRETSGIKQRKKTTVYLTEAINKAVDIAYIGTQHKLRLRLDKTIFIDALITAGLEHPEEIKTLLARYKEKHES